MKIILQVVGEEMVIETNTIDNLYGVTPDGSEWHSLDGKVWYTEDGEEGEIALCKNK